MDAAAKEQMAKVAAGIEEKDAAQAAAKAIAEAIKSAGAYADLCKELTAAASDKKTPAARSAAMYVVEAVCKENGSRGEPFMVGLYPTVLEALGDKQKEVRSAGKSAVKAFKKLTSKRKGCCAAVMPMLLEAMGSSKWQTKEAALSQLAAFSESSPAQVSHALPELVPIICDLMYDTKEDVAKAAKDAMEKAMNTTGNKDLEPLLPELFEALKEPTKVPETIHVLASTTFVQTVTRGALALVSPLLLRGYNERKATIKRQCSVITSNMSKLVEEPEEAAPFLPHLMPAVEKASQEVADPEARGVCEKAFEQLKRIDEAAKAAKPRATDPVSIKGFLTEKFGAFDDTVVTYVSVCCAALVQSKEWDPAVWEKHTEPYMKLVMDSQPVKDYAKPFAEKMEEEAAVPEEEEDEDAAELLCDCKFTLAYGSKILLHNTNLKLRRGLKYGLLGGNDSGKTTLMRAIANEQVEGFPDSTQVKCVFVEADILGELSHLSCVDYILEYPGIKEIGATRESVMGRLSDVGFIEGEGVACMLNMVGTLSGGWRMKLALARAMLQNADVLLMDEPTNHLDVLNVKWVTDYLCGLANVTCVMVSHDTKFLDTVCSNILRIQDLKLKAHKGNLSSYVEKYPDAMSFFSFKATKSKMSFPQPGFLEGVKSKGKPLMKMANCEFTYPGNQKPTIINITCMVSLASRVACVGQNGAGKSTMIKILTGELVPQVGEVWNHPNARIAYVAQHAFHHIENHLTKTPNEYIQWRYQYGDDREGLAKDSMIVTEEEKKLKQQPFLVDVTDSDGNVVRIKKQIEELYGGRRSVKKGYEYECKFLNTGPEGNQYVPGDKLIKLGWEKDMKLVDEKIAARDRMASRPLTKANVEQHLADVGLEAEYATHTRISALSGGQKVKVVLAAAMWNQPHIVILDEPTNYLDRDALGALAGAIEEFEGGVVMITHNDEFCRQLCPERWVLERGPDNIGRMSTEGDAEWMTNILKGDVNFKDAATEDRVDAMGNVIKGKQRKKKLSKREAKKKQKEREAKIAAGLEVTSSDEDM